MASSSSRAPVRPGDILAGKYRVDRVLGVGGMGVVVQATHLQLDERVALKFILPEAMTNAEVSGRFLREARLAVKLKSEHVAKVMDVGTLETGSPYIVMEYLEGTDLNRVLEKHGPLPFVDVAEYVIQACDAIAEAHTLGIVHRDLKPANLFLAQRADGAPLVKVLDFGISKSSQLQDTEGGLTKTTAMMGSPYFMSPEQMRSAKDVDTRSDVWSMGVVLYQLLTARLPFESDTLGGLMFAVIQEDPAALITHRPDVPHAFEAIVRRCLQRDRAARAQTVAEIAVALVEYAPNRARPIVDRIVAVLGGARPATPFMPSSPYGAAPAMGVSGPITGPGLGGVPSPATGSGGALAGVPVAAPVTGTGAVLGSTPPPGAAPKGNGGAAVAIVAVAVAALAGGGVALWARGGSGRSVPASQMGAPPAPTTSAVTTTSAPTTSAATTSAATTSAPVAPSASASAPASASAAEPPSRPKLPAAARPAARATAPSRRPAAPQSVLDDRN